MCVAGRWLLWPLPFPLSGWNLYLLVTNKTTIEYHEGVRAKGVAEKLGAHWHHPYDLGLCPNLHNTLGPHAVVWFCPTGRSAGGDGLRFRCDARYLSMGIGEGKARREDSEGISTAAASSGTSTGGASAGGAEELQGVEISDPVPPLEAPALAPVFMNTKAQVALSPLRGDKHAP